MIKFYNSIMDVPITRYNAFNQFLAADLGVGSDLFAVQNHLSTIQKFIEADKKKEAISCVTNLMLSFYSIFERFSNKSRALAVLVKEIDGKQEKALLSDDDIDRIAKVIEVSFTQSEAVKKLEGFKKKLLTS